MKFGYIRVSTKEQNEDRQLIALKKYNIPKDNIFIDKQSGKDFNRKEYKKMLRKVKKNDLIIVKSIDRLGRNYTEIIEQWQQITKVKKADILVIDMPLLDTTQNKDLLGNFISDLVLQILSFVADNERINIRQRQAEGIVAAKSRGTKFGKPQKFFVEDYIEIFEKVKNKKLTRTQAMQLMQVSKGTYYKLKREFNMIKVQ